MLDGGFRFVGGRLSLNFVMTLSGRYRESPGEERLASPKDLGQWCQAAGLMPEPPVVRRSDLAAARELREALYRLLQPESRRLSRPADVATLNRWARLGGLRRVLCEDGRSVRIDARSPVRACLSAVAADAVDLLSGPLLGHVRECERSHCSMLFLDTSRAGRRRWCDMARCGNRQKAAQHRRSRRYGEGSRTTDRTGVTPGL